MGSTHCDLAPRLSRLTGFQRKGMRCVMLNWEHITPLRQATIRASPNDARNLIGSPARMRLAVSPDGCSTPLNPASLLTTSMAWRISVELWVNDMDYRIHVNSSIFHRFLDSTELFRHPRLEISLLSSDTSSRCVPKVTAVGVVDEPFIPIPPEKTN